MRNEDQFSLSSFDDLSRDDPFMGYDEESLKPKQMKYVPSEEMEMDDDNIDQVVPNQKTKAEKNSDEFLTLPNNEAIIDTNVEGLNEDHVVIVFYVD